MSKQDSIKYLVSTCSLSADSNPYQKKEHATKSVYLGISKVTQHLRPGKAFEFSVSSVTLDPRDCEFAFGLC